MTVLLGVDNETLKENSDERIVATLANPAVIDQFLEALRKAKYRYKRKLRAK